MKIEIVNKPYYMGEACDCCEGYWYNQYHVIIDDVEQFTEGDDHIDPQPITFNEIEWAKAYVLDMTNGKVLFELVVTDDGTPDDYH